MNKRVFLILLFAALGSGCVSMSYTAVAPGTVPIGDLNVTPTDSWNSAPAIILGNSRKGSQSWTKDGLLLDRVMIIPAVADGETIFVSRDKSIALPTFKPDMLPNELEELVESSLVKLFGESNAAVNTSSLRPHRFGEDRGVLFDFEANITDSPDYKGIVGAFIANDLLYLMIYVAAQPHYYDEHLAEASSMIESARL